MNPHPGGFINFSLFPLLEGKSDPKILSKDVCEILRVVQTPEIVTNHNYVDEINLMRIVLFVTKLFSDSSRPELARHKLALLISYIVFTQPDKTIVIDYAKVDLYQMTDACKKIETMQHLQVLPLHDAVASYFNWRKFHPGIPECDLIMVRLCCKLFMAHLEMVLF